MLIVMPKSKKIYEFVLTEEQTLLSKKRTMLSFIRTGLAFIGLGLVVVKFFQEMFYQTVGIALILIGFFEVARSYKKLFDYNKRMKALKKFMQKNNIDDFD